MKWLGGRIHAVWFSAALCYGFVVGVILAQWVGYVSWWLIFCIIPFLALIFWKRTRTLLVATLVIGVLLGLARGSISFTQLDLYKPLYDKQLTLTGTLSDDADSVSGGLKLQLSDIKLGEKALPGKVWLLVRSKTELRRGDKLTVSGELRSGFGNFAATLAKAKLEKVERVAGANPALDVRDRFAEGVRTAIHDPAASLGMGFLLGKKSMLPEDLLEALKIAGLTHIVVASGYNLTILVRLARRLFAKASKFLSTFVSFGLIAWFIAMTGLSPSMTRAGLVTGFSLLAWYFGRKFHPVVLIGLVAAITVMFNPSFAWGDLGWMLSFAAFAGVVIVSPILSAYLFADKKVPTLMQILLETTAAQLVTAPIIMLAFGQLSVIALLANLLVGALIPLAMLLTAVAGMAGVFLPAFAQAVGAPAQALLDGIIKVVYWCADQPWALVSQQISWWAVALWYGVIFAAVLYMKWRSGYKLHRSSVVA